MTRDEIIDWLRELSQRRNTIRDIDGLMAIRAVELLGYCDHCAICGELNKRAEEKTFNVCKAAHHNGCGCDLDFSKGFPVPVETMTNAYDTGLPPDDITHYQLHGEARKYGFMHNGVEDHTFVPRERAAHRCGWREVDETTCGYPPEMHGAVDQDATQYQLDMQMRTASVMHRHAFSPRFRDKRQCGWTGTNGRVCGYPANMHTDTETDEPTTISDSDV